MNRADSPKPPVAPKPRTAASFTPVTTPKFPSSPRPEGLHSPNSMSRGPKPPIAPKPRLAAPHEWRASMYVIGSLNKCSNGRLLCVDAGLFQDHRPDQAHTQPEADGSFGVGPGAPLRDGAPPEHVREVPRSPAREETIEEPEDSGTEEEAPGAEGDGGGGAASTEEDGACDPSTQEPLAPPCLQHLEDGDPRAGEEFWGDVILAHDNTEAPAAPVEETQPPEMPLEEEEQEQEEEEPQEELEGQEEEGREEEEGLSEEGLVDSEPDIPECADSDGLSEGAAEGASEESPEQEAATATDSPAMSEEQEHGGAPGTDQQNDQEEPLEQEEKQDPGELVGALQEAEEDPHQGTDTPEEEENPHHGTDAPEEEEDPCHGTGTPEEEEDPHHNMDAPEEEEDPCHGTGTPEEEEGPRHGIDAPEEEEGPRHGIDAPEEEEGPRLGTDAPEEEAGEDSCHIIPFENDGLDEPVSTLPGSPYQFLPTESTSFCSASSCPPAAACGDGATARPDSMADTPCASLQDGSGQGPPVPDVVLLPETPDSLTNPYEMGAPDPAATAEQPGAWASGNEDVNSDAEGGLAPLDRKNMMTRARPHSGKLAGCVPETVPEESGPEAALSALGLRGGPEEARRLALPSEGKPLAEAGRALPAKPRAFPLYPRSLSVEGRELPVSAYREPEGCSLDGRWMQREDNLSLPCVIGSSGSFSQRNHLPSSGTSTPSSVVDIPPPFDLACITKKPITKSSPSLLIGNDPSDKQPKKKKSSFKRFLALTFRKKTDSKGHGDAHGSSSRSSSESSYHGPSRLLELDRGSLGSSPQLKARAGKPRACDSPSSLIFCREGKRRGVPFSRTVSRVESFEDRSRPPFLALPLTKPRSISFPNADTSDYENIPAMNSDYENIQIPPRRPARAGTFTKLFEEQSRALSTANENDGYVDMSSFNAFESKQPGADPDAESAYTEPYKVCPVSTAAPREDLSSDEEQGSSEEEDSAPRDPNLAHKGEGQSRAHVIAQELLASERAYADMLQRLDLDFHGAVLRALDEMDQEGKDSPGREELRRGLSELPALHRLHRGILQGLEARLLHWESQQKVADIFLARAEAFGHHTAHILQFDRYLGLLGETCLHSPRLAAAVREFEQQGLPGGGSAMKHRLLRVVQRLFQYQVLLTDYLNNLCPDSAEYEDTQGALTLISSITDRANDSMEQGENLQKLVHIEHSVRGQGDLVQPGREFLKEGTLMKVAGRTRRPRHLFLMSDVLLYTYPQKDGKYRLKKTLKVAGMKVSRPVMDTVPYALKIETPESCLTLSASSCAERDEWHGCLSRALPDDYKAQALAAFHHSVEIRERLGVSLGERPPTLVPVTHVMMCMNCGCDFSLTLRRHHCHACGKIVCRNCSRNKYPLKYLKERLAKVCDGCYGELRRRGGDAPGMLRARPASMSFPLATHRLSSGTFSSVLHSINPAAFRKQKKVPSTLTEVAASGEGSAISGYLSRGKKGKKHWKKLWFVIKGKVLYTYMASEDTVAMESMPLLGFTIAPEKEEGSSEVGPVFHLYHKKTLFYSFKAEDSNSAQRWIEAMENASVL